MRRSTALLILFVLTGARVAPGQEPGRGGRGPIPVDPRVQIRMPVSLSRAWVEVMTSLKIPHQYIEVPGGDHGSVITSHQAEVFAFFARHKR